MLVHCVCYEFHIMMTHAVVGTVMLYIPWVMMIHIISDMLYFRHMNENNEIFGCQLPLRSNVQHMTSETYKAKETSSYRMERKEERKAHVRLPLNLGIMIYASMVFL